MHNQCIIQWLSVVWQKRYIQHKALYLYVIVWYLVYYKYNTAFTYPCEIKDSISYWTIPQTIDKEKSTLSQKREELQDPAPDFKLSEAVFQIDTFVIVELNILIDTADSFRCRCHYPALEQIGVRRLSPHATRHTFATRLAAAGARTEDIQTLAGHEDYEVTANTYIHQDIKTLRAAIEKLS